MDKSMQNPETITKNSDKRPDIWKPKIIKTNDGYYKVESQAAGGCHYRVKEDLSSCQCPHFMMRLVDTGQKCKHMKQLSAYLKEQGIEIKKSEENDGTIPF